MMTQKLLIIPLSVLLFFVLGSASCKQTPIDQEGNVLDDSPNIVFIIAACQHLHNSLLFLDLRFMENLKKR
ncbi:hypothetical protein [Dyadobacter tibetensis]|uniref:hypothetical protein n=1 Tax=Dyadobacter tibetensis TaxID=1211851 RepID=UPI00046EED76|nr:hypothetical protein [Dyadobacter tibetensis]